ncbi:MAG TPA: CBS domain-containing protein [Anaerolineae bacterium]|nr:CBS domain-containing protein [Anaerolineae bacterium]HNU03530.1 CBS domain-containing protein [Anaerolineae bacterium]
MPEKLVQQIMHDNVIGCQPGASLAEVVQIMSDTDIHALVVTDDSGEVVGIISHMDVIPYHGQDLSQLTAAQIMTSKVICVAPEAPVREAVDVMVSKRLHRLVVTQSEGDKLMPVGVLSTTDIVRDMRGFRWSW